MNIDTHNQRKIDDIAEKLGWHHDEALNWLIAMGALCADATLAAQPHLREKTENRADEETPHPHQHQPHRPHKPRRATIDTSSPPEPCPRCGCPLPPHRAYEVLPGAGCRICPTPGCPCLLIWHTGPPPKGMESLYDPEELHRRRQQLHDNEQATMDPYAPGTPCPTCTHPIDDHTVISVAPNAGYGLCPIRRCECVLIWQWSPGNPLTISTLDDTHDTKGPSTSA